MDNLQLSIVWMSLHNDQWTRRDGDSGRRVATAAELDALAEPLWRWREAARLMKGCVLAVVPSWRSRAAGATEEPLLVSVEAP